MIIGYNFWDQYNYIYGVQNQQNFLLTKYSNIYHTPTEITELYSLTEMNKVYNNKEIDALYNVIEIESNYSIILIPS